MAADFTISAFTVVPSLDLFQQPAIQAATTRQNLAPFTVSGSLGQTLDVVPFGKVLTNVTVVPHVMSAADTGGGGGGPTRPTSGIVYPIIV